MSDRSCVRTTFTHIVFPYSQFTEMYWSAGMVVTQPTYYGDTIQLGTSNFEKGGRSGFGWAAYGILRDIVSSKIPQCLKTKVFEQCVLPVKTYGSDGPHKKAQSYSSNISQGILGCSRASNRANKRDMPAVVVFSLGIPPLEGGVPHNLHPVQG
ncbi:jg3876 [Pararge aegeria aegeria]|uniref:Jg3876 protein n=1 Tax=Pararge aegeria aegeria TaxID=348720 RepID=A0A8S4S5K1_9NEOP|nr:jg3876 [Pararge aegeria aegeria]